MMAYRFKSQSDKSLVVSSLRHAASLYDTDAAAMEEAGHQALEEDFVKQAARARAIADEIEDSDD
jgi:hypothetical protein